MKSIQETFAPSSICFGCGPANTKGLRIQSFPQGEGWTCTWTPEPHHEAFPGMLNGGICGALLDCHSNWAAAMFLMQKKGLTEPLCTVTADFHVTLKRPTPSGGPVQLFAKIVESTDDRAVVEATLTSLVSNKVTSTCRGTFVAVKEGHPAYHRWG
jgi:acyl-coenzyme A thioesterase PaaI-like protein